MCFILNDLRCYKSYTQVPKIILKCKGKGVVKNDKKKNKLSNLQNAFFFGDPSYF
jgi:hypothetical protein